MALFSVNDTVFIFLTAAVLFFSFLFCSVCIYLENQERMWEFPVITALVCDFLLLYHYIFLIITGFGEKMVPRKLETQNLMTFIKAVI